MPSGSRISVRPRASSAPAAVCSSASPCSSRRDASVIRSASSNQEKAVPRLPVIWRRSRDTSRMVLMVRSTSATLSLTDEWARVTSSSAPGVLLDHGADAVALLHDLGVALHQTLRGVDVFHDRQVGLADQGADLVGNRPGHVGQLADLLGHHRETPARLAGLGGLDGGVQGEHVGLVGDADDLGHRLGDAARLDLQVLQLLQGAAQLAAEAADLRVHLGGQVQDARAPWPPPRPRPWRSARWRS